MGLPAVLVFFIKIVCDCRSWQACFPTVCHSQRYHVSSTLLRETWKEKTVYLLSCIYIGIPADEYAAFSLCGEFKCSPPSPENCGLESCYFFVFTMKQRATRGTNQGTASKADMKISAAFMKTPPFLYFAGDRFVACPPVKVF